MAKKKTQWEKDLYFDVKFLRPKLCKYYSVGTPTTGGALISADIIDSFRMLRWCSKWDKGIDINPDDDTLYSPQYQEAFLKYEENEDCANHRRLLVNKPSRVANNNPLTSTPAFGCGQSSFDPYNLCCYDDEYLTPTNVAEMTLGNRDCAAHLLTAARLDLNSQCESPMTWGQVDPNRDDYHSDPSDISCTFWLPDITDRWYQQKKTHSNYADLSNITSDIISIIPHAVGVDAKFSLG